jgi:hypothetical protein
VLGLQAIRLVRTGGAPGEQGTLRLQETFAANATLVLGASTRKQCGRCRLLGLAGAAVNFEGVNGILL